MGCNCGHHTSRSLLVPRQETNVVVQTCSIVTGNQADAGGEILGTLVVLNDGPFQAEFDVVVELIQQETGDVVDTDRPQSGSAVTLATGGTQEVFWELQAPQVNGDYGVVPRILNERLAQ